jgi:hypothetical protein
MAILVDNPVNLGKGKIFAHMVSDTSLKELHRFAKKLGIKRDMFQMSDSGFPYYAITISKRLQAIEKGAKEAGPIEVTKAS